MAKRNHPNPNEGSGQSKAAKRRAKKKAKAKSPNSTAMKESRNEEEKEEKGAKKQKMTLWDSDEEEEEEDVQQQQIQEKKNGKHMKEVKEMDEEEEEEEIESPTTTTTTTSTTTTTTTATTAANNNTDNNDEGDSDSDDDVSLTPSEEEQMLANSDFKQQALDVFATIISPTPVSTFYSDYHEKKPLHISRNLSSAQLPLLSKSDIETYISKHSLKYAVDLNVTNVISGRRHTLDIPNTVASSSDVWSNFSSGCSVRLLCPQNYSEDVWETLSALEHVFGCMVGANAYLTPRGSQGFAPHYDDVDVFVMQQEGKKRWRVYEPGVGGFRKEEVLPRVSSKDYDVDSMPKKPYLDVTLGPGDLLYLPRGWIHQAVTTPGDEYSLHLTVSSMMQWSWCDFLEQVLPLAQRNVTEGEGLEFREGLPIGFLDYMGVANDNDFMLKEKQEENNNLKETDIQTINKRTKFRQILKSKMNTLTKAVLKLADYGSDEMGKIFTSDRLPPMLSSSEKKYTSDNKFENGEICASTLVRLTRPGIARLCMEDGKAIIYHCGDNARSYRGQPLSPLEFEPDDAPTIEMILNTVAPFWVKVDDLRHPPSEDLEDKIGVVESLYEEGIVSIEQPGFIKERVGSAKK
ncbi:hypothetical protein TrVE_jg9240 [Triparma verrucosa]|uniref:Bifunctional lysine-specific demethylase and histidyl-hydroxylase n=1 Tax=Triparma verrucosa TaxID=1606542 RepID=A0A9W7BEN3_9STRA|nr:hypothetical protein TrVE_jg9240 [Triparma verrucosa]